MKNWTKWVFIGLLTVVLGAFTLIVMEQPAKMWLFGAFAAVMLTVEPLFRRWEGRHVGA